MPTSRPDRPRLITSRWLDERRRHWARLELLLDAFRRRGISSLTVQELREVSLLYRQIAADLSSAREDPTARRLAVHLNQLLGRAHNLVYRSRGGTPRGVLHFYRETYPRVVRAALPYTLTASLIFAAASAAGWLTTLRDPSFVRFILGGEMVDTIERKEMWTHSIVSVKPLASSRIMTNNLTVCLTTAASGVLCGLGTVLLLVFNGMLLGVIGAACWRAGMSLSFWSFVAPHGALELPAIFLAGGAGLILARSLLFPGSLPRRDALTLAGGQAVRLVLGVIPLLILAGLIEGFVSPSTLPEVLKLLIGAAGLAILVAWVVRAWSPVPPVAPS